jgi:hypothetical protein
LSDISYQQGRWLMVENGPEARNARLVALMERAQTAFEESRRLVEEARKIRAEAEAKLSVISRKTRIDDAHSPLADIENAAE